MSRNTNQIASLFSCGLLFLSLNAAAQTCRYVPLDPDAGKVSVGHFSLNFGPGDNISKPQAWQGPLTIAQAGASCTVNPDVRILERPFYQDGKHLLVTTYSGSNKVVFVIEASTCAVLWRSKPFVGKVTLKANTLQLGNQTIKVGSNCIPRIGAK
jgi:hypothetical protein